MGEGLCARRLGHFGLRREPFGDSLEEGPWVELADQRRAIARIRLAAEAHRSLVALVGPAGSGKTRVLLELRRIWSEGNGWYPVYLSLRHPEVDDDTMARYLARKIGVVHPSPDTRILLRQIYRRVQHHGEMGQRIVLLVDDADQLEAGVERLLNDLAGLLSADGSLLSIVLGVKGRAQAEGGSPDAALADASPLLVPLAPLSQADLQAYLSQRLDWAGARAGLKQALLGLPWEKWAGPARPRYVKELQTAADGLLADVFVREAETLASDQSASGAMTEFEVKPWLDGFGRLLGGVDGPGEGAEADRLPVPAFPEASNEDLGFGVDEIAASVAEESAGNDDDEAPQLPWID